MKSPRELELTVVRKIAIGTTAIGERELRTPSAELVRERCEIRTVSQTDASSQ